MQIYTKDHINGVKAISQYLVCISACNALSVCMIPVSFLVNIPLSIKPMKPNQIIVVCVLIFSAVGVICTTLQVTGQDYQVKSHGFFFIL